ncbi:DMT family transporter [Devosia sp.]|uniref:DMT family transporter n=1 Tax=Devosia sp. TaxID=1871048 RepID=UPI003A906DB6
MTTVVAGKGRERMISLAAAVGSGFLLTLMVHFNGELGRYGNALFSSWVAHGTGTVAAVVFLMVLPKRTPSAAGVPKAPLWAYLGGLSGAATVMLTSSAVNSALALSGTLALGLAGQVLFGLAADRWGWFGLPSRRLERRDVLSLALILSGSAIIIFLGRAS